MILEQGTYQPPTLVLSGSPETSTSSEHTEATVHSQAKAPGKLFEVFYDVESHGFGFELLASTPADGIKVYSVKQWGPAAEVGVVVGSIVTEVNGVNVSGMQYADIVTMINNSNQNLRIRLLPPQIDVEHELVGEKAVETFAVSSFFFVSFESCGCMLLSLVHWSTHWCVNN